MKPARTPRNEIEQPTIAENLTSFLEELQLAYKWQRPSILIATCKSKLVLIDAQVTLEKRLRRTGQKTYYLNLRAEPIDLPLFLSNHPERENTVFFVSGLMSPGSSNPFVFRALNIRRELLVDNHVRVIFWLTPQESAALPTQALDFWAFRHRVLEFFQPPSARRVRALIKSLDWPIWNLQKLRAQLPGGLVLREELLKEIPEWNDAAVLRARLLLMLAVLRLAGQEYKVSQKLLDIGLDLAKHSKQAELEARYYAAIGRLQTSLGRFGQAAMAYQHSIKLNPQAAEAWGELSQVLYEQGRKDESLSSALKAASLNPRLPSPWVTIGDLQGEAGHVGSSVQAYNKALAINSKDSSLWVKLGDACMSEQKPVEALRSYKKAHLLDRANAGIWFKLGSVYLALDRSNNAIRAFYKAARLNPSDFSPWKNLGDIYRRNQRLIYARRAFKKALALAPSDQALSEALRACYPAKKK